MQDFNLKWGILTVWYLYFYFSKGSGFFFNKPSKNQYIIIAG